MPKKTKPEPNFEIDELVEAVDSIEDLEPEKFDDEQLLEEEKAEVEEKKPAPKKRKPAAKVTSSEDLISTTQKSLEQMTKQWEAIQGISTAVTQNLERVHGLLKEIPIQEMLEKNNQRPAVMNKFVMILSAGSLLLSILGLSLAHSARQEVYAKEWLMLQQPRNPGYALLAQDPVKELSKTEVANTETVKAKPVAKKKSK